MNKKIKVMASLSALAVSFSLPLSLLNKKGVQLRSEELVDLNNLVRLPTMSFYGDTKTQMGFNWVTTDPNETIVELVKSDDPNGFVSDAVLKFEGTREPCKSAGERGFIHRAVAKGLVPDTSYRYRFGDPTLEIPSWCEEGELKTSGTAGSDFNFIHLSDPQGWEKNQYVAYHKLLESVDSFKPSFLCLTGDIVNNSWAGHSPILDQWEWALTNQWDILKNYPVSPVSGNHDAASYDFSSRYNLESPDEEQITGTYYSYTYQDVHFIGLNTNDDGCTAEDASGLSEAQMTWLENDLEANKNAKITIAMMHKGIFDAGAHCINEVEGKDYDVEYIRNECAPLFTKYGVDLVLQGHDHLYSESYPIVSTITDKVSLHKKEVISPTPIKYGDDVIETYINPKGTIYLNTGSASGSKYYEKANYNPELIPINKYGNPCAQMFTNIEIKGQTIISRTYIVDARGRMEPFETFAVETTPPIEKNHDKKANKANWVFIGITIAALSISFVVVFCFIAAKRKKN